MSEPKLSEFRDTAPRDKPGCIGWSIQVWNGDYEGIVIEQDDISGCISISSLILREEARRQKIERLLIWRRRTDDSSAGKSDDDVMERYIGHFDRDTLKAFLQKALVLVDAHLCETTKKVEP